VWGIMEKEGLNIILGLYSRVFPNSLGKIPLKFSYKQTSKLFTLLSCLDADWNIDKLYFLNKM
jgi:hypothetical protein